MDKQAASKSRTKTLDVTPAGEDRFSFVARLTDRATNGNFAGDSVVIHDFGLEGEVEGPQLVLRRLEVQAYAHPYSDCPFVIPATGALIGASVLSGWRRTVLATLGGPRGCTHVNTLLLGLSELTTMAIFLRINPDVAYSPETRADGRWIRAARGVAPALPGACFGLRADGPVLAQIQDDVNEGVDGRPSSL